MTGFNWGCIGIFVVGFGGADKWAFNIGEAGVEHLGLSEDVLSGAGVVGVTVRCGTGCTFIGVVELLIVVNVPVVVTPVVVVVVIPVVINVFWLGYVIVPGLVRTRIPS